MTRVYISDYGNDKNDGRTRETAIYSLTHAVKTNLMQGDGRTRTANRSDAPSGSPGTKKPRLQTAATQQARENFAKLARAWIRLAEDLEWSQAFLVAVNKRRNRPAEKGADRSRRPRLIMKAMKLPTYR